MLTFKKGKYENNRLAILAYSEIGETLARVTINLEEVNLEQYGSNAMCLNDECPDDIIMYLLENGYIKTIGKGFHVRGGRFPIAIADEEWLNSIEEYVRP